MTLVSEEAKFISLVGHTKLGGVVLVALVNLVALEGRVDGTKGSGTQVIKAPAHF